jgi:nickel/cobalt exporter
MMLRRTSLQLRLLCMLLVMGVLLLLPAQPTAAHPLGNFTINLYSRLVVGTERLDITYVVDMAEIPTFQEFGGEPLAAQAQADYLAQATTELRDGLRLVVDGREHDLKVTDQQISFPPGQGSLLTTRIELRLETMLPQLAAGTQRDIAYEDTNYADRLGWHEVLVQPASGVKLVRADVPTSDLSNELRAYPQDMLASPPNVRTARVLIEPSVGASTGTRAQPAVTARSTDRFAALITTEQRTPLLLLLTLLAALGLGGMHALSPGHGKTVVAAYLVGARGTARHAVFLGLTVTVTHTLGVFVLGLVTLYASRYILPEQLYPWLGVASGGLVVAMGLTLLRQRVRGYRTQAFPDHDHAQMHDHTHTGHDPLLFHEHGPHTHTHVPPGADGRRLTWHSLLALGISGGLVPCPSALVVMLSAIALGRTGFGLVLIVAFSLGLAGVLTGIGILFVHGGRWLSRMSQRQHRFGQGMRLLPVVSALVVTTAGLMITAQALVQTGVLR